MGKFSQSLFGIDETCQCSDRRLIRLRAGHMRVQSFQQNFEVRGGKPDAVGNITEPRAANWQDARRRIGEHS